MLSSLTMALPFGAEVIQEPGSGRMLVRAGWRQLAVRSPSPAVAAVVRALATEGATDQRLAEIASEAADDGEMAEIYFLVESFGDAGLLTYTLLAEGQPLAIVAPLAAGFRFRRVELGARFVLSRFACLRREGHTLFLESALSATRVLLPGWKGAALAAELAQPRDSKTLLAAIPGVSPGQAADFLHLLASAGMVAPVGEGGVAAEDVNAPQAMWEFHDLFFHARSRQGRSPNPLGGTYRFKDFIAPLPAVKPRMSEEIVPLDRPDMEQLLKTDVPLTAVLEERKSRRRYGENPITLRQLGEFLYRTARLRRVIPVEPQELASRPYPSGGSIYELELYVAVNQCADLQPGLYHYAAEAHQLCRLKSPASFVETLLANAKRSTALKAEPQVLIVVSARFGRLMWKYQSLAYALILKNTGVLYQSMYLVATAMGLAPCAVGGGNSDLFAQAAGLDYYTETSVGEFLLGSRVSQS